MTDWFLSFDDWSSVEKHDATNVEIYRNSKLFLRKKESTLTRASVKPKLPGGSIEYDVNLANQDSGCVAGVYLVQTRDRGDCSNTDMNGERPGFCRSIDAMQANKYGFETKAFPCKGRECKEESECHISMHI